VTAAKVDFSSVRWGSVEWTNLVTLYLRAYESRSRRPILGDQTAAEAVDRIDYDFKRIYRNSLPGANQYLVTLRAKQLDDWCSDFLARHPDAVVLHLGCGLDGRAFRLVPPPSVLWFDLDQPAVIELRRQLYDESDRYRMIGSSVTDPAWLDQIPTGRPTLVVAEGLLMYVPESEVRQLLERLTDRFDSGEMLFDTTRTAAVESVDKRHHQVGHPRCPRPANLEPEAPVPRAEVRSGRLREDRLDASAVDLQATVGNARARLRRAQPLRILSCRSAARERQLFQRKSSVRKMPRLPVCHRTNTSARRRVRAHCLTAYA
jgi:O-methyltransferase involved in polyketide biosynthesis